MTTSGRALSWLTRGSRRSRCPSREHRTGYERRRTDTGQAGHQKWICEPCGFIYDPEEGDPDSGIDPGTPFEDIPDDWMCPICGASKAEFRELEPGEFPED